MAGTRSPCIWLSHWIAASRSMPAMAPSLDISWRPCVGLVGAGGVEVVLILAGGCDKTPRDVCGAGFQAESCQIQRDMWRT